MIALTVALAAIFVLALCLVRLLLGPTLYDRVIAANAIALISAVVAAALSVWRQDESGVDVSIALIIGAVVSNVAFLKFSSLRTFQAAIVNAQERR